MKGLLVVDRAGYKINESKYKKILNNKFKNSKIIYTKYEDSTIRKVRNWKIIGNLLLHVFRWLKSYNYVKRILRIDVDEIICLNPIVGILLGINKYRGNYNHLIVGGFLFEKKKNRIYYLLRKEFTRLALINIDKVIVYGKKEVQYYEKVFHLYHKFEFVPYGIDYLKNEKFTAQSLPHKYIFSGGGSNRDYATLVKAYNSIKGEKLPLVIATQQWRLKGLDTSNIIVLTNVVNETFGDVMKRSSLLILSLKNTELSAGHMVMLQAMKIGCPILVNDIPSIRDYVDDTCVTFYESGNKRELSQKILTLSKHLNKEKANKAQKLYNANFTSAALVQRLIDLS